MNKLIDFVLKNRLLVIVLGLFVVAGGYFSYKQLPIDAFPDVSPALVQVFTQTEGLAPEEVEKYVTFPVEVAMNGLPNLKSIRSVSNFGLSVVNVYFEDGTDIYFARQIVNERLTEAREQIPEGFGDPQMGPISTGMGLILFYYLEDETGKYTLEELRTIQDWLIKFQLQTVPGVTEVLGIGGWEKQFHVVVDPNALLRYDLSVNDIVEIVKKNNLNVGASFIERDAEEFLVRSIGLATKIQDLENIVVKSVDGTPVYLKEIADIQIGGAVRRGIQTRNGIEEVVAGMVVKLYGTNSSTVIGSVEQKMTEINKTLPEGISLVPYYEQKTLVESAVKTVTDALIQGIILVTLILMLFMGSLRPSIVVALSIPFSIMVAFIGMQYLGLSINLMSFGGLAIAIGMMVDASIVLVENIDRLKRKHISESFLLVVSKASKEVLRPIIFAIVIIITVFIPLFTLHGVEGKTFKPLAFTIALAMVGSLIFAVLIAPVLSSFFLKTKKSNGKKQGEIWIVRALIKVYSPFVTFFVKKRYAAIVISILLLIAGAFVYPKLGSEFTPTLQEGTLIVRLSMAPSISLEESKKITQIAEKRVMRVPEVRGTVTRIGRGEVGAHTDPVNSAEMYILLKPEEEWRTGLNQKGIELKVRKEVEGMPGVLLNFTQPIRMTVDELLEGVRAELAVKLFGDDLGQLKKKAEEISSLLRGVKGAADIQVDQVSGKPQLKITVDRHSIARYGLNLSDVQQVIRTAIGGETAGQIFEGIRRFDVFVRFAPEYRSDKQAISNLLISSPNGLQVPLSQVATIEEIEGPRQITREQNQRFITIQCNVIGRDIGSFVEESQAAIEANVDLPVGYYTVWGGQFRLQQEANKRFAIVIPITLLLIFFLLFSSFNSLKNSMLILLNIPLALVGGVIGLWLTGQNLSVPSSVGFIALFGIALENGMVLVTYFNQLIKEGKSIDEASIEGAKLRLRPVLMTAATTALGLIPLLIATGTGSEVQRPLATVVVGGLFTSTILTLLVLPALYKWFAIKPQEGEL
ncbi:Cobalt-zinc-cadmium resistance protein CzcA; Cation efflux system protein CusA [hydrothermal vent metagenome]|uniref:Cobalt-zinc-cadmium resistance protein CzcA Cation efflux system protein CusA n=1 Tax=hydrothermal vent metagenome TaxID=652676 RepID=A0A3B1BTI5_9ZZZZ